MSAEHQQIIYQAILEHQDVFIKDIQSLHVLLDALNIKSGPQVIDAYFHKDECKLFRFIQKELNKLPPENEHAFRASVCLLMARNFYLLAKRSELKDG